VALSSRGNHVSGTAAVDQIDHIVYSSKRSAMAKSLRNA